MATIGEAFIEVKPDAKGFGAETEKTVLSQVKGVAGKAAVVLGGAFAARGTVNLFGDALAEAEDARKTLALTQAVITSTGGAANVSADQLSDLAGRLSNLSAVDDEVIQSAGNVLLTFTNVKNGIGQGNDVFDQAATAALNMSAALKTDLQGATLQVGKALNDPVKGLTALSRAGVSFTAEQKEQVKAMVAAGDTLGAQKLILAELNKEFAGAAEAAASPLERLRVTIGNAKEALGTAVAPGFTNALQGIGDAVLALEPTLTTLGTTVGSTIGTLAPIVADAIGPVVSTFADVFGTVVQAITPALDAIGGALSETFSTLGPALIDTVGPIARTLSDLFATVGPTIIGALGNIVEQLGPVFGDVVGVLADVFTNGIGPIVQELGPVIREVATVLSSSLGPIVQQLGPVLGQVAGTIGQAFATLAPVIGQVVEALAGGLAAALQAVLPALAGLVTALAPVVAALVDALAPVLPVIADLFGEVAAALGGALGQVLTALTPLFVTLADVITDLAPVIGQVAELLAGALGAAIEGVLPVVTSLVDALSPIVEAFADALAPVLPLVADLFGTLADALGPILDALAPIFDVLAPIADLLGGVLAGALEAIAPLLTIVAELLAGVLGTAIEALVPILQLLADALAAVIGFVTDVFAGDWSAAWESIQDVASTVWDAITGVVTGAWDLITGAFSAAFDFLSNLWSSAWGAIVDVVSGVWDSITGTVRRGWEWITGLFQAAVTTVSTLWHSIWDGLTSTVSGVFDSVIGFVRELPGRIASAAVGLWDGLTSGLKSVLNGLIGLWNRLDFGVGPWTIPDWVPIVGGNTFGIADIFPDVPLLAGGAIIGTPGSSGGNPLFDAMAHVAGLLIGHPGHDRVTQGPTLAVLGEAGGEIVLPLTNRRRMIELLLAALGLSGSAASRAGSFGGIPAFAAGGIIGASIPSGGDVATNTDALMRLIRALLEQAGLDPAAVLGPAGITPPDAASYDAIVAAAERAGAAIADAATGVTVSLSALAGAAGFDRLPGSGLGAAYRVEIVNPSGRLGAPWFTKSFDGFPAAQLAMLADRTELSEVRNLLDFAQALTATRFGQEYHRGLWFDRDTGRVLGFSEFEDVGPSPTRPPGFVAPPGAPANVAVGSTIPRDVIERWRADADRSAGLVRAAVTDFTPTDYGLVGRTRDVHSQGLVALSRIPGAVYRELGPDGAAQAVLPGNVIVTFAPYSDVDARRSVPAQSLDRRAQVDEARRAWSFLTSTGVISSSVPAGSITADNLERIVEFLPWWVRQAVLASGYLPTGWADDQRAAVDLPTFLRRVVRLGDGGIVQPRDGGTLAFLAERGQAEAVVPLPTGLIDALASWASGDRGGSGGGSTVDRSVRIEQATFDLSGVRDAARVPAAVWTEGDRLAWQYGG